MYHKLKNSNSIPAIAIVDGSSSVYCYTYFSSIHQHTAGEHWTTTKHLYHPPNTNDYLLLNSRVVAPTRNIMCTSSFDNKQSHGYYGYPSANKLDLIIKGAVLPNGQCDGSYPFEFSGGFLICFSNKSEISVLVSIPFEMVLTIPKVVPS
eukprot:scaffold8532_cov65-Attheya_sp.AAC.4